MADKKTTKAEATRDLQAELKAKRQDLLEAKKSNAAGELVNPQVINTYRKDIARLLTEINQKEQK